MDRREIGRKGPHPKPGTRAGPSRTEGLADEAILFLLADPDRLQRFLAATGLDPSALRASLREPAFIRGVLDFIASDDALIIDLAQQTGRPPEALAAQLARPAAD